MIMRCGVCKSLLSTYLGREFSEYKMDFLQVLFSPETPAHIVSSVPLKPLCECREVHGESHLKRAVWSPWHLRCLALLREDPCRCFLNLFAPWLPAGDTEKCRESGRRQRAALSKRLQATGLSATVNAEHMAGATLGWLSTERLPLSVINHLCWGEESSTWPLWWWWGAT